MDCQNAELKSLRCFPAVGVKYLSHYWKSLLLKNFVFWHQTSNLPDNRMADYFRDLADLTAD